MHNQPDSRPHLSDYNNTTYQDKITNAALTYALMGYSVLPLYGTGTRAKQPLIPWKTLRYRRAGEAEIREWFDRYDVGGIGIVTGVISRIVVLDFDDVDLAATFADRFPHLTETYTITSAGRGLPHYYYAVPPDMHVPTLRRAGADLLSNGCYVVAYPTQFANGAYTIRRGGGRLQLTSTFLDQLTGFMQALGAQPNSDSPADDAITVQSPVPAPVTCSEPPRSQDAAALYRHHLMSSKGRNHALFRTACYLRDRGYSRVHVSEALMTVHALQAPLHPHPPETYEQRLTEASQTIASAFKRPPRPLPEPLADQLQEVTHQIPNCIREELNRRKETAMSQLLDALRLEGVLPGDGMSYTQALQSTNISQWTVRKGFDLLRGYGLLVEAAPPDNPQYVSSASNDATQQPCGCVANRNQPKINLTIQKSEKEVSKGQRGRPRKQYIMPTDEAICEALGIAYHPAVDHVPRAELQTARQYRVAQYREYIKRRPGVHHRGKLAYRLGISQSTLRSYDDAAELTVECRYDETFITWDTLDVINVTVERVRHRRQQQHRDPTDWLAGVFLEVNGVRHPPIKAIAARALKNRETVVLKEQIGNDYRHFSQRQDLFAPLTATPAQASVPARTWTPPAHEDEITRQTYDLPYALPLKRPSQPAKQISAAAEQPEGGALSAACAIAKADRKRSDAQRARRDRKTQRLYRNRKRLFKKPLPVASQEKRACDIIAQLNPLCEPYNRLSWQLAREVALICDPYRVRRALRDVQREHERGTVRSVPGLFLRLIHFKLVRRAYEEAEKYSWPTDHLQRAIDVRINMVEARNR